MPKKTLYYFHFLLLYTFASMKQEMSFHYLQQAVSEGNHGVFGDLYSAFRSDFIRFGCKKTGCNEMECADAFQDAVVALYENIRDNKLPELNSSVKTYLFSIGKFKLLNIQKRKIQHSNFCSSELTNDCTCDYNLMENKSNAEHIKKQVEEFLAELSEEERLILDRYYIQAQPLKEIAADLGISEGAVRKRKFDILKRLSLKAKKFCWFCISVL
jgi:RNA polymerase sigma factor (sigma-70 family)